MAEPTYDADLSGKTIIVTGANSGIGMQIADNLAGLGARVVMACRSEQRGRDARDTLAAKHPSAEPHLMLLDQSKQSSIRSFIEEFDGTYDRLDALVNNAGIYPDARRLSEDGIEMTWATNVLGYFQLTRGLHHKLASSAPSRVVFVASAKAGGLDMDDLQWERRSFGGIKAYMQSKQANRMLGWVFAERYKDDGISVNVVHPGGINTGIGRNQKGIWGVLVRVAFKTQKPVTEGADTATWLAACSAGQSETGGFWADRARRPCEFRDMEQCHELWRRCEAMVAAP